MTYNLPANYQSRLTPEYFHDTLTDSTLWQADVYRAAAMLARRAGVSHIVDIGCGTGGKLIPLASEFKIIGYDYGGNIDICSKAYKDATWIINDFETEIPDRFMFAGSVTICADIIEHLINPDALIKTLKGAVKTAAYVLISTPDRERLQQGTANGPPANKAHCREWTLAELEAWFVSEGLPVKWSGWTISYDKQPDKMNTCLIVLSQSDERIHLPITFQPAPHWRKRAKVDSNMLSVWMTPTPEEAGRDQTHSINNIVCRLDRHLPDYNIQLVEETDNADILAGHAGQGAQLSIDVAIYHGIYNTAQGSGNFAVNAAVISNLKSARIITAPSNWIADVLRRDLHVNPRIIPWGVDCEEWQPVKEHQDYVIWNKARVDNITNPQPMLELAARAHDVLFLTTFGEGTPNVKTVGRQPYAIMKEMVRNASVYLSTNVETFSLGILEAAACGIPILSFRQGAQAEYIQHGVHGFLAEPGDIEGLYEGLQYCLKYRKQLGDNARSLAKQFTWDNTAKQFANVFLEAFKMKQDIRPHKIDESLYKVV